MDDKTLHTLEYFKILERLVKFTSFSASAERALSLRPTNDIDEALRLQAETREAVQFLATHPDFSIGAAKDVRTAVGLALHGGVLSPVELIEVKSTLSAARTLTRTFERVEALFPNICAIVALLPPSPGLIDAISKAISDRAEIVDNASPKLAIIRRDLQIIRDRLLAKLQRVISDPHYASVLQETLITQREGRFVVPIRSEFKGKMQAIVHDQSASGATLFVEPLGVVELNNSNRENQLAERDEERRILTDLSEMVAAQAETILQTVETIASLDLVFARGRYAEELRANEPILHTISHKPQEQSGYHPGSVINITEARHPLLDAHTVVPIDVELDNKTFACIITGPNTGGKTVTLKTIGLLALMAQSGLHIPANSGSHLTVFNDIFADIGDEQSIEQSLSTFSGHINNIIHILAAADSRSLVILDELGAGTDPLEGAALARAILTHLLDRSITTLVTTHHPELKAFAHSTPGVVNASVEFDVVTLRPTYHLTIGLPGRSNALAIAQRLGMPETIVSAARADLNPEDARVEDLLDDIHQQRDLARKAFTAAEKSQREIETMRRELAARLETIEDERHQILEEARAQAESEVKTFREEISFARRGLSRSHQPLDSITPAEEIVTRLEEKVEKKIPRKSPKIRGAAIHRPVRVGDKVRVRALDTRGIVTTINNEDAEVQAGTLRIRTKISDLQLIGGESSPDNLPPFTPVVVTNFSESPGTEIDLRGKQVDEALDALEKYLDAAFLAGLPFIRIIHGKGTGKLRSTIRQHMGSHPQVRGIESGGDKEGGEGITVLLLKQ